MNEPLLLGSRGNIGLSAEQIEADHKAAAKIPLVNSDEKALVDPGDYDDMMQFDWYAFPPEAIGRDGDGFYVGRIGDDGWVEFMHDRVWRRHFDPEWVYYQLEDPTIADELAADRYLQTGVNDGDLE
jgi:hypothetical protein